MGNPTRFHVLVPECASVWRALAALFRLDLLEPRGVPIGDVTDLLDIVRFCRENGEPVEVPLQSDGRVALATLGDLFERTAAVCARGSSAELERAAVQDFSISFDYRAKDTLSDETIRTLLPLFSTPFSRRYVTRGAIDPNNAGISYGCELEIIDPFALRPADAKLGRAIARHLANPDAYVNDRALVESYADRAAAEARRHIGITVNFEAGFISQYALRTMEVLSAAVPGAAIFGGTPDDSALAAAMPLSENNLYQLNFQAIGGVSSSQRALGFLERLLTSGLFGDPELSIEEIQSGPGVQLRLANGGHELLSFKDRLAPGSELAQIIDEAVLRRGLLDTRAYLVLVRGIVLGGLDIPRLALVTHATTRVRDPGSTSVSGQPLVRALQAFNTFRAQAFHDFPEERARLEDIFDNAHEQPAHLALARDRATGMWTLLIDVHWCFNGYFPTALDHEAREHGYVLREPGGANVYTVG